MLNREREGMYIYICLYLCVCVCVYVSWGEEDLSSRKLHGLLSSQQCGFMDFRSILNIFGTKMIEF